MLRERADHSPLAPRDAEAAFDQARGHAAGGAHRARKPVQQQLVQGAGRAQGAGVGKGLHALRVVHQVGAVKAVSFARLARK